MSREQVIKITKGLIIVTCIIWIIWDVYAVLYGSGTTESYWIKTWSYSFISIPFTGGILAGHFWINIKDYKPATWMMFVIVPLAILRDVLNYFYFHQAVTSYAVAVFFFLGIASGVLFWNQSPKKEK